MPIDIDEEEQAILTLQVKAKDGDLMAQYALALRYQEGTGVQQNLELATELLEHVARSYKQLFAKNPSDANIKCILGCLYERGHGVKQSISTAGVFYAQAAWDGNAHAQYKLGYCCEIGDLNFRKNLEDAANYYNAAAKQGHTHAQFKFGWCLETGNGIKQNLTRAIKYYERAALHGHQGARINLERCRQQHAIKKNNEFSLKAWLGFKQKNKSSATVGSTTTSAYNRPKHD